MPAESAVIRTKLHGTAELCDGTFRIAFLNEGQAKIVDSLGIAGLQFYGFLESGHGALRFARPLAGKTQGDLRLEPAGLQAGGGVQFLQGFGILRLSVQNFCKVVMRCRISRREFGGFPQLDGGVLQLMLLRAQDPKMKVSRSQAGLKAQSFCEVGLRLRKLALLSED